MNGILQSLSTMRWTSELGCPILECQVEKETELPTDAFTKGKGNLLQVEVKVEELEAGDCSKLGKL